MVRSSNNNNNNKINLHAWKLSGLMGHGTGVSESNNDVAFRFYVLCFIWEYTIVFDQFNLALACDLFPLSLLR